MEENSAEENELWAGLEREALEEQHGDFKSQLFPVSFEPRKPEEIFRSFILSGHIPIALYCFYLAFWGINFSREVSPLSYLLLFVLPLGLAWLVAPVFRFTSLSRVRDILGLFGLGLLLPLVFAMTEATVRPDEWRLSFAAQATDVFFFFSVPTTIVPFFLLSLGVAWTFKYLTKRELKKAPWWDESWALGRTVVGWVSLTLPLLAYGILYFQSLPSEEVRELLARPAAQSERHGNWLPSFSQENEEAWRELARRSLGENGWNFTSQSESELKAYGQGAVKLLEERRLPLRGSYDLRFNHYDYLQVSHRTDNDVELLTLSLADGLLAGFGARRNLAYRKIVERLENNALSNGQLLQLQVQLQELKETLPPAELVVEETLRIFATENKSSEGVGRHQLGLLGQLERSGVGPESLATEAWINRTTEDWLALKVALHGASLNDLIRQETAPENIAVPLSALRDSTRRLLNLRSPESDLLGLVMDYENAIDDLLELVDVQLRRRAKN